MITRTLSRIGYLTEMAYGIILAAVVVVVMTCLWAMAKR